MLKKNHLMIVEKILETDIRKLCSLTIAPQTTSVTDTTHTCICQYFAITSVVFSFQNRKYNWFYRESSISSQMRLYVIFEIKYSVCVCVHVYMCVIMIIEII